VREGDSPLRVWIIGAAGFLGRRLSKQLLQSGHLVTGVGVVRPHRVKIGSCPNW